MKPRGEKPRFIGIPLGVAASEAFKSLPAWCRALYLDLRRQFNGFNNGRIAATDTILGPLGWSHSTVHKGLDLLIEHKLIERVRRGGLGQRGKKCSLYAFMDETVEEDEERGIRARLPILAYRDYRSLLNWRRAVERDKVHRMPETVHGVDRKPENRFTP
jgi:hypothetical protein